jgi:ABC-type multidrug transport system ATPase subunit
MTNVFFNFSAESGAGKSTLINLMLKNIDLGIPILL